MWCGIILPRSPKKNFFGSCQTPLSDNIPIIQKLVQECKHIENLVEATKMATGEFVMMLTDNDSFFERAIPDIVKLVDECVDKPDVAGVIGGYVLEQAAGSQIMQYQQLNNPNPVARVQGYLGMQGPNLALYSVIRRSVAIAALESTFFQGPFQLSYAEPISCFEVPVGWTIRDGSEVDILLQQRQLGNDGSLPEPGHRLLQTNRS